MLTDEDLANVNGSILPTDMLVLRVSIAELGLEVRHRALFSTNRQTNELCAEGTAELSLVQSILP
jgi:hypothetical protein